ncbi:HNH endonuclease [Paenarthrobacter nitroguajacolicus]|uniref:HNH endonuclease n=1 Tax=Paenarthrobacter nitroguajacolicus TaxID=211146 RepID=UPI003C7D1CFC
MWQGNTKDGYAQIIVNGRWITVHRWLYMHLVGPIPNAHEMHHECEKPRCVRPGHLTPLTPEQHRAVTAFSQLLFGMAPSAVLAIENTSRTDKERMFARVYGLPADLDAEPAVESVFVQGKLLTRTQ